MPGVGIASRAVAGGGSSPLPGAGSATSSSRGYRGAWTGRRAWTATGLATRRDEGDERTYARGGAGRGHRGAAAGGHPGEGHDVRLVMEGKPDLQGERRSVARGARLPRCHLARLPDG